MTETDRIRFNTEHPSSYTTTAQFFLPSIFINCSILMRGRKLEIVDAQESDTGGYSCQANNIAGLADKDFFLKVLGENAILPLANTTWSLLFC